MDITIRHIEQIDVLSRYGNFRLAANKLCISQPALSRSILNLEEKLGVRLFNRTRGKLRPTRYGALILQRGEKLLHDMTLLHRDISMLKGGENGVIHIGCGPFPGEVLAGDAIGRFNKIYPKVTVKLTVDYAPRLTGMLRKRLIDFYVADASHMLDSPEFDLTPLPQQQGFFCCRKGHPLTETPAPSFADIFSYPMAIMWISAPGLELFSRLKGKDIGKLEEIGTGLIKCDNLHTLLRVVGNGDAVTVTSREVLDNIAFKDQLHLLPVLVPELRTNYYIVALKERSAIGAVDCLHGLFREVAEEVIRKDPASTSTSRKAAQ
ncbi:LysR family transcriptional regulator [Desulfovibrio sp. Fe33]|uniref:LysR family transcriptional regulator n=1 Tax=Desulfovibrio sp. Fe33 TaxID=3020842 RepID=UPI00234DB622|nr:LysR family transcriptional regulator [Desulfovibrio sp. Fe33]